MRAAVVVPAYQEGASLSRLLASVRALPEAPRVVVAVDGGHQPTVDTARAGGAEAVVLPVNHGSYAARNAALAHLAVDGLPDLVLFTDADCVVTTDWVRRHAEALADADLSAGGVRFTFRGARPTPAEWVDSVRHLQQERYVRGDGYGATCNLAVRGTLLAEQRFDAALRTGGDAELCRRLVGGGARLVYTPDAAIEHPARDLEELWVKTTRLVSGIPHQTERWAGRPLPRRRPTRAAWRRAGAEGVAGGPAWGVAVSALDWVLDQRVRRALIRAGRTT